MLDGTLVHWTRLSTPEERKRQWADASPQERVKMLVVLLRDLPPEHRWTYRAVGGPTPCGSIGCAIGVARVYYGSDIFMTEELAMSVLDADTIFCGRLVFRNRWGDLTPHDVADALEHWAATGEARLVPTGGAK